MNQEVINTFADSVSRSFRFLVDQYGFTQEGLTIDDRIPFAYFTYVARHVGVECVLDTREEDVSCRIVRVRSGRRPPPYTDVDEHGVRYRQPIYELLLRRGIRTRLFHDVGRLAFKDRIPITLDDFAAMVKNHAPDVLADSPDFSTWSP